MLRLILYALLIWFLYNLVFRFIIPVYRATRQMKEKFKKMHDRMQEEQRQQGFNQAPAGSNSSPATRSEDYIDFEEIK